MNATSESATLVRMRRILALLAAATAVGGIVEMAMLRHWDEGTQLIPWFVLVPVAIVAILVAGDRGSTRLAQVTGAAGVATGGIGVLLHLSENLDAGEDLAQYARTWESMPIVERLWLVLNGSVGDAPLLAPGMVTLAGVLLLLAVLDRH